MAAQKRAHGQVVGALALFDGDACGLRLPLRGRKVPQVRLRERDGQVGTHHLHWPSVDQLEHRSEHIMASDQGINGSFQASSSSLPRYLIEACTL